MIHQLEALDVTVVEHVCTRKRFTTMKDQAFSNVEKLNTRSIIFRKKLRKIKSWTRRTILRINKTLTILIRQWETDQDTENMLSTLEYHRLKPYTTGNNSVTTPCASTSNVNTYTILQSVVSKQSNFSSLPKMFDHIILEGDDLALL